MDDKKCRYCNFTEHLAVYSVSPKSKRIFYICRACMRERSKKYRLTVKGRANVCKALRNSRRRHLDRACARVKLYYQIKIGKIIRPKECQLCKRITKIFAHHTDYKKPLKVKWLCLDCHCLEHKPIK